MSWPTRGTRGRGRGRTWVNVSFVPNKSLKRDWQRGAIVWGKVRRHRWWPATVICRDDCGDVPVEEGRLHHLVYWYGHGSVGPVSKSNLVDFKENFSKLYCQDAKTSFLCGVHLAILDLGAQDNLDVGKWNIKKALNWAEKNFPLPEGQSESETTGVLSRRVEGKLRQLRMKYTVDSTHAARVEPPLEKRRLLQSLHEGTAALNTVCLACIDPISPLSTSEHPLFQGSICGPCKEEFLKKNFSIGLDMVAYHCCVCVQLGEMILCSEPLCARSYCHRCLATKASKSAVAQILQKDEWSCFLCEPNPKIQGLLAPRFTSWKKNLWKLFQTPGFDLEEVKNTPLRILCLQGSSNTAAPVLSLLQKHNYCVDTLFLCNFRSKDMNQINPFKGSVENLKHLKWSSLFGNSKNIFQLGPIHIILSFCEGSHPPQVSHNFMGFFNIIATIKKMANARINLPLFPVLWVFELSEPFSPANYFQITRFLELDPAFWSKKVKKGKDSSNNQVWTNFPLVWLG